MILTNNPKDLEPGDYVQWQTKDGRELSGIIKEIIAVVEQNDGTETVIPILFQVEPQS